MKRTLIIACALAFSAPMAFAECAGHKVNAAVDVDRTVTTASIEKTDRTVAQSTATDTMLPTEQKADRVQ